MTGKFWQKPGFSQKNFFEIITEGNLIYVRIDGKLILEYRDPKPIFYRHNGFHAKNCIIESGGIQ